jgi:hypothetical protein
VQVDASLQVAQEDEQALQEYVDELFRSESAAISR